MIDATTDDATRSLDEMMLPDEMKSPDEMMLPEKAVTSEKCEW